MVCSLLIVLVCICWYIIVRLSRFVKRWEGDMSLDKMLQRTYLRFIEEEATAKRSWAQIRPGDWSMVKRVGG